MLDKLSPLEKIKNHNKIFCKWTFGRILYITLITKKTNTKFQYLETNGFYKYYHKLKLFLDYTELFYLIN